MEIRTRTLRPLSRERLDEAGWAWLYREGPADYLSPEVVRVTADEAEALYLAGLSLFQALTDAADVVVRERRFAEMGIPDPRMGTLVEESWADERALLLYGRFDLAGLAAPRLLEFNADTATTLPETAILQWALLKANDLPETLQFNLLYERLVEQFGRWRTLNADLEPHLALAGFAESGEDMANLHVLAEAAREAGFTAHVRGIDRLTFSPGEGVFVIDEREEWQRCDFFFKLVPWEFILEQEPALFDLLYGLILDRRTAVANPPYALLLQSKRLLKVAYDLAPELPYLLPAAYDKLPGVRCVEKPAFGREGANVTIYHPDGVVDVQTGGDYDVHPTVFQEFAHLPMDDAFRQYQAGLFYVGEPCALGFRRGGTILGNTSQFAGHLLDE